MSQPRRSQEEGLTKFGAIVIRDKEDTGTRIIHDLNLPKAEISRHSSLPKEYIRRYYELQTLFQLSGDREEDNKKLYFEQAEKISFTDPHELEVFEKLAEGWGIVPRGAKITSAKVDLKPFHVSEVPTRVHENTHLEISEYSIDLAIEFSLNPEDFPSYSEAEAEMKKSHTPKDPLRRVLQMAGERFNLPWLITDSRSQIKFFENFHNGIEMRLHYTVVPPQYPGEEYRHRNQVLTLNKRMSTSGRSSPELYVNSMTRDWPDNEKTRALKERLLEDKEFENTTWEDWADNIAALKEQKSSELHGKRSESTGDGVDDSSLNWVTEIIKLITEKRKTIRSAVSE